MPSFLAALKNAAMQGARKRGHSMGSYRRIGLKKTPCVAYCLACGAGVVIVIENSRYNRMSIYGDALGVACIGYEKKIDPGENFVLSRDGDKFLFILPAQGELSARALCLTRREIKNLQNRITWATRDGPFLGKDETDDET